MPFVWNAFDVAKMNGCAPLCSQSVHGISPLDILSYHHYFIQLHKKAKLQWIVEFIYMHSRSDSKSGITFIIAGKPVCQSLWICTLGISTSLFYKAKQKAHNGCLKVSKSAERSPLQKSHEAIAWMHGYFDLVGDFMPNRMVVHLPSNLSKLSVYQRMVTDMTNRKKDSIISKSHFFRLWEEHFSHVNIPKVSTVNNYHALNLKRKFIVGEQIYKM